MTMLNYRGYVLRVETVGKFVHYAISKGASDFLVGHVHSDSETEAQVITRLKTKVDNQSVNWREHKF